MKFPFLRPVLPKPETWVHHLNVSFEQHYFSNFGPLATKLEAIMAEQYLSEGYKATLVTSNTLGIVSVLQALDVRGKRVIVPDFTFAGTLQSIIAAGGIPLICDVDPATSELCPNSVKSAFETYDNISTVVYVRCYGFVNDVNTFREICDDNGAQLVIDAAAALSKPGEVTFGSPSGEIEIFSLHATKVFAIGEGGMIAAPEKFSNRIRQSANFGFNPDDMPEYASWSCFPTLVPSHLRDKFVTLLASVGIETKKYYWPGLKNGYKGSAQYDVMETPVSERIQAEIICLPVYSEPLEEFWPSPNPMLHFYEILIADPVFGYDLRLDGLVSFSLHVCIYLMIMWSVSSLLDQGFRDSIVSFSGIIIGLLLPLFFAHWAYFSISIMAYSFLSLSQAYSSFL